MKRQTHTERGRIGKTGYELIYTQKVEQFPCFSARRDCPRSWGWYLYINGDYEGEFRLKREALAALSTIHHTMPTTNE